MTTNIQLAKKISEHVEEIVSVALKSVTLDSMLDADELPPTLGLTQGYRCTFDADKLKAERKLRVMVDFTFGAYPASQEQADAVGHADEVVSLNAEYVITYRLREGAEFAEECLEHFASVNGPYNLWPYWRELVQSATGRIGLSSIIVPVFRPVPREVDDECNSTTTS